MILKWVQGPICKFCGKPTIVHLVPITVQTLSDGTLLQKHFCKCAKCGAIKQDLKELVSIGYIKKWLKEEGER